MKDVKVIFEPHARLNAEGCVIVNLVCVLYLLQDACAVALRRMERSGLEEVYLLENGITKTHLFQNKEESK